MTTAAPRTLTRTDRWAAKHTRLWCFTCQSFRLYWQDADHEIKCAACDRSLMRRVFEAES